MGIIDEDPRFWEIDGSEGESCKGGINGSIGKNLLRGTSGKPWEGLRISKGDSRLWKIDGSKGEI